MGSQSSHNIFWRNTLILHTTKPSTSAWFSTVKDDQGGYANMRGECVLTIGHYYIHSSVKFAKDVKTTAIRLTKPLSEHEKSVLILKYGFPCLPTDIVEKYYAKN